MHTQCPRCSAMLPDPGRDFPCPRCGAPVRSAGEGFVADEETMGPYASVRLSEEPSWKALPRALQHLARLLALVLFGVMMVLCYAALLVGIPQVLGGAPGSDYAAVLYILTPAPVGLFALVGQELVAWYLFLVAAIIASLAYLLYSERRQLRPLISSSASRLRAPDRRSGLGLVQLPQVFLAIFFFDIIFILAVLLAGTSPRTPDFGSLPDWYLYFTFAHASVYEELAARTLLCGLPLLLAYMLAYGRRAQPRPLPAGLAEKPPRPSPAATRPAPGAPAEAPPPGPVPENLIDGPPDDPARRLVPRAEDAGPPVASTPALGAPAPKAPPVEGPGLLHPRIPEKDQALTLATSERPVPESTEVGRPIAPQRRMEREIPAGPVMEDTKAPRPPPVVIPPRSEPPRPAPADMTSRPPTMIDHLRSRSRNGLWGYVLGGGFEIGPLEAFFIVGSALMFGWAHVPGWDMWKMLPTFVAGLGFGYLFLKVGIHVAIMMHFAFDYLSLGLMLLPGFWLVELLLTLLFLVVGAFYFGHYAFQIANWFRALGKGARA